MVPTLRIKIHQPLLTVLPCISRCSGPFCGMCGFLEVRFLSLGLYTPDQQRLTNYPFSLSDASVISKASLQSPVPWRRPSSSISMISAIRCAILDRVALLLTPSYRTVLHDNISLSTVFRRQAQLDVCVPSSGIPAHL